MRKLSISWFSFSCCEDSTIVFMELLNEHWKEWKKLLDIRTMSVLQRRENWDPVDVAFVEGAIGSPEQEEKLKRIRVVARKVIAIGSCACTGMPSAQRNTLRGLQKEEADAVMKNFSYSPTVRKVSDVVPIDGFVPGCPMDENMFLSVLQSCIDDCQHDKGEE